MKEITQKKTYKKIITASLELFNRDGERHVSTNHIAAHLNISPGNLYYYFHNKEEIILELFRQYRADSINQLSLQDKHETLTDLVNYFRSAFTLMWQYRFLFQDTTTLDRNQQLSQEYFAFSEGEMGPIIQEHFTSMIQTGALKMSEEQIRLCIMNIWIITKYWFSFHASRYPDASPEETQNRGIIQVLSLLQPLIQPQYQEYFIQTMENIKVCEQTPDKEMSLTA